MDIVRDLQRLAPCQNLAVRIVCILRAKRRVATQAFEHDGAQTPPVAFMTIALLEEYLWRDVIGRTDR